MSEKCHSLSVPTLNVSGLNSPVKRHRLDLQETQFKYKGTHKSKAEGLKMIFRASITKREQVAILTSEKIDSKSKIDIYKNCCKRQGHYIMTKRSIHQEDVIIINIHVLNIGAPKYSR